MTSSDHARLKETFNKCICASLDKGKTGSIKLGEMQWVLDKMKVGISDLEFYGMIKSSDACFVNYSQLLDEIFSSGAGKAKDSTNKKPIHAGQPNVTKSISCFERIDSIDPDDDAPSLTDRAITWPVGPEPKGLGSYSTTFTPPVEDDTESARLGALRVSCWNVKSPELSGNILEMYPGWSMLTNPEQCELLDGLMLLASQKFLEEDSTLGQILGDAPEKEFRECSAMRTPEVLPLNAEKYSGPSSKQNVEKFFERRLDSTQPLDQFIKEWLEKPLVRWQYWKKQSVREFIAEDGSGGKSKENENLMKVKGPIWDQVAWDLTLGVGDLKYGWKGRRVSRCSWLLLNNDDALANVEAPENGVVDYDFFKLAVWDLLLGAVKEEARQKWRNGPEKWDEVFAKTKKTLAEISDPKKTLESVIQTIVSLHSDIVVLSEMSEEMIGAVPEGKDSDDQLAELCQKIQEAGGRRYTLFKSGVTDAVANTIILTCQERFETGVLQPLKKSDGKVDNKNFGVKVKPVDGRPELQVIGVHLSGGGHNVTAFFDELELRLGSQSKNTIVAGDFNFDFRDEKKKDKAIRGRPLCQRLLEQSKTIWELGPECGTVSKKRTPFQAQVSKINLIDFQIKDNILISEDLSPEKGTLSGHIARAQILPDASCPSDHHPLTWQAPEVAPKEGAAQDAAMKKLQGMKDIPRVLKEQPDVLEHCPERHELTNVLHSLKRRAEADHTFKLTLCGIMELPALEAPAKLNRHIMNLRNGCLCQYAFKMSSSQHRKLVADIVEVSTDTGRRDALSRKEFKVLHDVVTAIVGEHGQATWARAGELLTWKTDEDFAKIDYNYDGKLDTAEVLVWLKQIAHVHRPWGESVTKCLEKVLLRCRAKREVLKYELARDLMNTMELYDEAHQEFLEMIADDKDSMDLQKMSEGDAKLRQPDHLKTFDDLYHHGKEIMEEVADFGEELRHSVKAPFWSMGPLKNEFRAKDKIEMDYGGDVCRLLDVVRFSLICKDLQMVSQVIKCIGNHGKWEVVRVKSGFDLTAGCALTGGYRDVKINARNKTNGHIIEIQLHILMFYVIKQERGHKLYESARMFDVQGITSADDILVELTSDLLKEMASIAKEDLENAERASGKWSKKSLEKRMTLFDCLRLGRSRENKKELKENAHILLNAVGELEDATYSSVRLDKHFHRSVMLLVGRDHSCQLPAGVKHEDLLEKVVRMIEGQSKRGVSCNIVLAQCKSSLANFRWGSCFSSFIELIQQAIQIYRECGLPENHPVVLKTKKNLGAALVRTADLQNAIEVLRASLAGMQERFGFRDRRTAQVLLELGVAIRHESKQQRSVNEPSSQAPSLSEMRAANERRLEALWLLSNALSARRAAFGEQDERVGNVFFEMALVKVEHHDYNAAMEDFQTCMAIWEKAGVWNKKMQWEKENLDILNEEFNRSGIESLKTSFAELTHGYPNCQPTLTSPGPSYNSQPAGTLALSGSVQS